jgi:membrane-associated phospholipid phosphatase
MGSTIAILLIGFSRLYLGVHWLTDILAGYLAGFVWLVACIFSLEIWQHRRELGNG